MDTVVCPCCSTYLELYYSWSLSNIVYYLVERGTYEEFRRSEKMTFKLPILEILDQIDDETHGTILNKVIWHLYIREGNSPRTIAALLGVSEATVHLRIPKGTKKRYTEAEKLAKKILGVMKMHNNGKCPKEIAYDLDVPLHQVYKILKKKVNKTK